MRSRVRTRTHGSVGRRESMAPSDPILNRLLDKPGTWHNFCYLKISFLLGVEQKKLNILTG